MTAVVDMARNGRPGLNAAQRQVIEQLRTRGVDRPEYPEGVADELRASLEGALGEVVAPLDEPLWVGKFALARVHGCELRFLHEDGRPLVPGPAVMAGTVAHRGIQLSVTWHREPTPLELVEAAVERIEAEGERDGRWFAQATPAERAEVLGLAAERLGKFLECFPPLRRSWAPTTESTVRAFLADGKLVLTGRVDLVLGRSEGMAAGKAFVDFKTGAPYLGHVEDLRFYALVETLRLGVPPFRLASYYLDGAVLHGEDVSVELLHAAAHRVVDGARKLVALRSGQRAAIARPGPGCRRCPLLDGCAEGRSHLAAEGDDEV